MQLNNIKPLDGVRTLAILLVIIWHYFDSQITPDINRSIVRSFVAITSYTWSGVDLFFVLSGFLIGRILIYNRDSKNYFKAFYLRRFFRIFPAYYLVLLGYFILLGCGVSSSNLPGLMLYRLPPYPYIFYIQNFWMENTFGANWLGVTWSLAVEEQFYIIIPLILFSIKPKHIPKLLLFCIIAAPICRALLPNKYAYVLLPARMDSLSVGVLIAYYYLNGTIEKVFKQRKKILLLLLFISLTALSFMLRNKDLNRIGGTYVHSILALLYGSFLVLVLVTDEHTLFARFLSTPFMSFIARISYMIYLTHQIFLGVFQQLILKEQLKIFNYKGVLVSLLALLITILFSTISYYAFEKPMLSLGKKYNY